MLNWIKNKFKRKQVLTREDTIPTVSIEEPIIELTEVFDPPDEEDILADLEEITFNEYTFNPSAIDEFYALFRPHQVKTIKEMEGHNVGQISNPTGTGKTFIQKYIHVKDMVEKTKNNEVGVYVIAAHRLLLCSQLFDEIIDLVVKCGLETDLLYIGSGRYPFGRLNYNYKEYGFDKERVTALQTTSIGSVEAFVVRAKQKKHHVLIVTTYHSFDCLKGAGKIDICTFDEAHTTVEERFTKNIKSVLYNINKKFFFTATRKTIGDTKGQNNFDLYGPVISEMSPLEAVEAGEIVEPRIHFVKTLYEGDTIDKTRNVGMLVKTVVDSFTEHEKEIKKRSSIPDMLAGKLLVTNSGLKEIQHIVKHPQFIEWCKDNAIQVFSFSSKPGETAYNFENDISREEMLEKMNELGDDERAILFHYDILTEGIDLPAITGVMLMRSTIPFIKLLQNLGRACRLYSLDRKNLYSGKISPGQHESMVKPYSWVILPTYINENWEYVKDIIRNLRESYNIPVENVAITDTSNSFEEKPPESVLDKTKTLIDLEKEIQHVFEDLVKEETNSGLIKTNAKTQYVIDFIKDAQNVK